MDRADKWKVSLTEHNGSWTAYIWSPGLYGSMALTSIKGDSREDCERAARERIRVLKEARRAKGENIFYVMPD